MRRSRGVRWIFFFQAEDGIRDGTVTGVQTCALPIFASDGEDIVLDATAFEIDALTFRRLAAGSGLIALEGAAELACGEFLDRSEERRVGKECRCRWSPCH